jgi:S1-C subfamily serine protease
MSSTEPRYEPLGPDDDEPDDEARPRGRGRWLLALVLVLALVVPVSGVFLDELDFSRSADEVREQLGSGDPLLDAVLLVRTVRCDGQTSTGSAFVLDLDGEAALVTNRHVVDRASSIGVRPLTGGPTQRVSSYRVSPTRDVAVLTLSDDSLQPTALSPAQVVGMGDPIQIVGFPGGRPAAASGSVAEVVNHRMLLNVRVQQGSSGSPVVDDQGAVVGQVTARTEDGRGLALRISEVIDALGSTVPPPTC